MKIFNFDPCDYAADFRKNGYVHVREGITHEFHNLLLAYAERDLATHKLDAFAIQGKKEQALFELPEEIDIHELHDVVCAMCGLNRDNIILSERHLQIYDANANPEPPAHKDRYASQVAVGFSISIPAGSQLVLYLDSHRETNPFNTSLGLRRHLQPEELPEIVLKDARELTIEDADRDVVMFGGSNTWHLRRRSANALNLYMKFNDFSCDPLGEDPFSEVLRARTLAALNDGVESALHCVPVIARRLDSVSRTATRDGWREVLEMRLFGEEPIGLTEFQYKILRAVDGRRNVSTLASDSNNDRGSDEAVRQILLLARNGGLDLV